MVPSKRLHVGIVALVILATLSGCGGSSDKPAAVKPTAEATQTSGGKSTAVNPRGRLPINDSVNTECDSYSDDSGHMDADHFKIGLECVIPEFDWPNGMAPDDAFLNKSKASLPGAGEGFYENGLEWVFAAGFNTCAWEITWLRARQDGDTVLESKALDYMTKVTPNFEKVIPGFPLALAMEASWRT